MRSTLLVSVSALLLVGSAALAQNDPATGQGQMITPGQEGGGVSSGTKVGKGTAPGSAGMSGTTQMDPGGEAGATTTNRAATTDCPPPGPANAQGADRSGEVGNKPGC
jgi:hypothetical protein